jgi:hypothetical protein
VYAIQSNRHDRVLEFFEVLGTDLQAQPEWRDWFLIPFLKVLVPVGHWWATRLVLLAVSG